MADIGEYSQRQSYGNVLPGLNLVLEPTKHLQLRFAAAKVLVRPILDSNTPLARTTSTAANSFPVGTNTVTARGEAYYNRNPAICQETSFYGRSFYLSASVKT